MSHRTRRLATVLAMTGAAGAVALAPSAAAVPQCTNTAPNTRICSTNGSSQITTSPQTNAAPYGGFPYYGGFGGYGGLVIGLGGIGPLG